MKIISLHFLLSLLALAELPVRWSRTGVLKDIKSVEQARDLITWKSDEEFEFPLRLFWVDGRGIKKTLEVKKCEDYLAARDLHYRPLSNSDRREERRFRYRCESLRRITEAKPSKESYLKDYKFSSGSLGELPPCLGGMGGSSGYGESVDRAMESLGSWHSFAPDKSVVRAQGNEIVFQDREETITAEFMVWGDFNNDGIEDVLALVATQSQGMDQQYKDYQAVALTRLKGESFFRALGEQGEWACLPQLNIQQDECRWDTIDSRRSVFLGHLKKKQYEKALSYWSGLFEKCEKKISEERKLHFLVDLSHAAYQANRFEVCEKFTKTGLQTTATEWTSTKSVLRALAQNHDLCVAKLRIKNPKLREAASEVSDEGILQPGEAEPSWAPARPDVEGHP